MNSVKSNTYNIIRRLGFRPSHIGTKFIILAVKLIEQKEELFFINDIYKEIANSLNINNSINVKSEISYAIHHRNENKSIQNFENIFGYEYDKDIFSNKDFIEELSRIIK